MAFSSSLPSKPQVTDKSLQDHFLIRRYANDVPLNLGIGFGLIYLTLACKNELNKMVEQKTRMEALIKDAKTVITTKDDGISNLSQSNDDLSFSVSRLPMVGSTSYMSNANSVALYSSLGETDNGQERDEYFEIGFNHEREEGAAGVDHLEAELETELERLQLNLDAEESFRDELQQKQENLGQVTTWERMKEALFTKFVPMNYAQQLYGKLQDLEQESKSVQEYTESFYRLQSCCNLPESEEVRIRRYLHGLRGDICYDLVHVRINTLEEAYSFASSKRIVKCYSCRQEDHVQVNCPKKPVLTIDMETSQLETKEEVQGYTTEGILTSADKGLPMLMPHVSPIAESTCGNVFRQSATLYNPLASKTCPAHVVLDNGSNISLISRRMVDTLGLTTMIHRRPRKVHSFRVGDFEELAETVRVGVRMGDFRDYVLCHVSSLDACDLVLGTTWQYSVRAVYRAWEQTYRISQGRRVFTLRNQPLHKMPSHQIVLAKVGNDAYLPPHRRSGRSDWRSKKIFNSIPHPTTFDTSKVEGEDDECEFANSCLCKEKIFHGSFFFGDEFALNSPPIEEVTKALHELATAIAGGVEGLDVAVDIHANADGSGIR
ncbi:hypothetical protein IFM89_001410 [Coptis chinensis]|uniref:Retrotransposon gag domain-containing protein n=1 Tax=Coptis chinensis TaxID=261450 RepID=A0A835I9N9_9MAGN|nr:hypothetical protein IFM89_001410 [Coptis chinensis]